MQWKSILRIGLIVFLILLMLLSSCSSECKEVKLEACSDMPPTGPCSTNYISWFFDKYTNTCIEKEYMTCDPHGFETEAECLECLCTK